MITDADVQAAEMRMTEKLNSTPHAIAARYDRRVSRIVVSLNTGLELAIPPHIVEGLNHARPAELAEIEISPTGLGLHFPTLDADLYIPSLLEGLFGSSHWMAAGLGKLGGSSRSEAKAAASRSNGKLGGRPRKTAS
ncbi:MAG: DUF2442 domain-containing protein [Pseudomonadales bacterium]|nr:DUF2442 domain-containing protein [Pseudomonadales bacterium]